jgi:hypothetical protein
MDYLLNNKNGFVDIYNDKSFGSDKRTIIHKIKISELLKHDIKFNYDPKKY